jgi:thiol-disulfide isomerase/thioredoxin
MKGLSIFSTILIATLVFTGCSSENSQTASDNFIIEGNLANLPWQKVYLTVYTDLGTENIDSAEVMEGNFSFAGKLDFPEMLTITSPESKDRISFFGENSKITIAGDFNAPDEIKITGSAIEDEYNAFNDKTKPFDDQLEAVVTEYRAIAESGDEAKLDSIEKAYDAVDSEKTKFVDDYIANNPASVISQYLVLKFKIFNIDFDELTAINNAFDPSIQNSKYGQIIQQRIDVLAKTAVGQPAPEITQTTPDGEELSLSSLKGQYVLIDFWASWCGPCRAENPNVVKLYAEYNPKGFEIFGVSLDKAKDRWVEAIEADGLQWKQVSDLAGWKNAAAREYGVNSIPHTVLVDPDGIIIARGLRGDDLRAELEKLLPAS